MTIGVQCDDRGKIAQLVIRLRLTDHAEIALLLEACVHAQTREFAFA